MLRDKRCRIAMSSVTLASVIVLIVVVVGIASYVLIANPDVLSNKTAVKTTRIVSITASPTTSSFSSSTTTTSTCYSEAVPSNSTLQGEITSVYNVTTRFNNWDWNNISIAIGKYSVSAVGHSGFWQNGTQTYFQTEPQVSFSISNGTFTQKANYTNLGGWNGQAWLPDFPQGTVSLFNGNFSLQFLFTCSHKVMLTIRIKP